MGTKYTSNTASGYNSTPPTDDGAQTEANKVKWSTIKNKLTDPLANQINAINTDVNTALDYGPVSVVSSAVTLGSAHNNQFIELSGAATPTLDSSDGLGAGWYVDVKNVGTQVITMARERTNDTIDGTTADVTLNPLDYIRFVVNAAANGFYTVGIKKATAAQVTAGTASDAFITPESLGGALIASHVNGAADGAPLVTDIQFSISSLVSAGTWSSVGKTGSGAENIWSALDGVPAAANWVELKIFAQIQAADEGDASCPIYTRKNGGSASLGLATQISRVWSLRETGGSSGIGYDIATTKAPITTDGLLDIAWVTTDNSTNETILMYCTGYGKNNG